jgi:hypothetical protein
METETVLGYYSKLHRYFKNTTHVLAREACVIIRYAPYRDKWRLVLRNIFRNSGQKSVEIFDNLFFAFFLISKY